MALRDQPYLPLYIQDYLTDEKLNECSAASQGVYIKILCVLHKSDEYGKFLLKQNDKQTSKQTKNFASKFARHITFSPDVIEDALDELLENRVMTLDGDILFQKRMVRDNEISLKRSSSGKKGGEKTQFASKFALAKVKANSEYENEYENEYKNRIDNEVCPESEIDTEPPKRKKPKTSIPKNFTISERVKKWASEKNHQNLEDHLESFKLKCRAKDYQYVDWDEAFMNAVRDNWAKISNGVSQTPTSLPTSVISCPSCGQRVMKSDLTETGCVKCMMGKTA